MNEELKLGAKAKDKITGPQGEITAKCEYLVGETRLLLQPKLKDENTFQKAVWFDTSRLEANSEN